MFRFALLLFVLSLNVPTFSRAYYWVYFTDKPEIPFDPYAYFDQKAIERRQKFGLPLDHWTDRPVSDEYIREIQALSDSILVVSRWLNAVAVETDHARLSELNALPFVRLVEAAEPTETQLAYIEETQDDDSDNARILREQTAFMEGAKLKAAGLTGKGVRVAVFDAGFPGVDKAPELAHIQSRIIKTYDFVRKSEPVFHGHEHGTMVTSCIAGISGEKQIGMAPDAEFLLARTENFLGEPLSEEYNWLAAAEWADKNGADLINSSLGYTAIRYFYKDMNGKTAVVTQAANLAASKGILVINAAGNEGSGKWKYIGAPADADSVVAVGGVSIGCDYIPCKFSSVGPTFDGRIKPDVCAFGQVMARGEKRMKYISGTSFASPLTAGFAACILQQRPKTSPMEMKQLLQKSAHLYPYYDYANGYGVPLAGFFVEKAPEFTPETAPPTFELSDRNELAITLKNVPQKEDNRILYYHIQGENGKLRKYGMILAHSKEVYTIDLSELTPKETVRIYYEGYLAVYRRP